MRTGGIVILPRTADTEPRNRLLVACLVPLYGHYRIRVVQSFDELISTPFGEGVNAFCWARGLMGDFGEVVGLLGVGAGITEIGEGRLRGLPVSAGGRVAVEELLADQRRLRERGLEPVLEAVDGYPEEPESGPVRTDVGDWHVDSATVEADTWLCTYFGAPTEGLPNEEARRCVEVPETRAELWRRFGGADEVGFEEHLREECYDLHYAPRPGARPWSFGVGNLWRIATAWPGCPVPPCIHRAPATSPGQPPRLLLIC